MALVKETKLEVLMGALQALDYKVLLKNYECSIGGADLIAKKKGKLFFFGIDRERIELRLVETYYMKRYGIQAVQSEIVSL